MSLSPGTRLGVYDVTAQIGQGGMGEVYRARDTKLDQDVARRGRRPLRCQNIRTTVPCNGRHPRSVLKMWRRCWASQGVIPL